jgi:signal transduction histidine kinase
MSMKTQTKTSLLLLFPFLSILLLFSGFIYVAVSNYSHNDFFRLLEIRAYTAAKAELDLSSDAYLLSDTGYFERLPHEKDYFFLLKDSTNLHSYADSLNLPFLFFQTILSEGKAAYRKNNVFYKGIIYNSTKGDYIVIASAENYFNIHHAAYLQRTLLVAVIAAFLVSFLISVYFSKYIFKPITEITEKVKQISSENLHLRLTDKNNNDELNVLAKTFNNMLDRIETSFETQNNFISNASHELRTPLTAIIGEADVAISKVRTPEEYIESLKIILDEAEKLDKKTQALLFLAQTGFKGKALTFGKVRVDQLLWDVKQTIENINSKSKIRVDMSLLPDNPAKLKVNGNEQLLHLALTNIVNNACKYSDYEIVNISIGASDTTIYIVVRDKGIGIPENELKYIYDPFFRASNTKNYEGYGIGLPLTRNIIRMHKGEMFVSSIQGGGTTVQINLPIGNFTI